MTHMQRTSDTGFLGAMAAIALAASLIGGTLVAVIAPRVAPESFPAAPPAAQPAAHATEVERAAHLHAVMDNAAAWEVREKQQAGEYLKMSPALKLATQQWEARETLTGGGYAAR